MMIYLGSEAFCFFPKPTKIFLRNAIVSGSYGHLLSDPGPVLFSTDGHDFLLDKDGKISCFAEILPSFASKQE